MAWFCTSYATLVIYIALVRDIVNNQNANKKNEYKEGGHEGLKIGESGSFSDFVGALVSPLGVCFCHPVLQNDFEHFFELLEQLQSNQQLCSSMSTIRQTTAVIPTRAARDYKNV